MERAGYPNPIQQIIAYLFWHSSPLWFIHEHRACNSLQSSRKGKDRRERNLAWQSGGHRFPLSFGTVLFICIYRAFKKLEAFYLRGPKNSFSFFMG